MKKLNSKKLDFKKTSIAGLNSQEMMSVYGKASADMTTIIITKETSTKCVASRNNR